MKGTELHAATIVATPSGPYKTLVGRHEPIIKFTTLFGLLAVELAITLDRP